jgi:hypothetical protein
MALKVDSNVKEFRRSLKRIHRRQIPFATMIAINDTIFQVRARIVERTYPRAFTVRNKRFAGTAFRINKAKKTNLTATLYDRLDRASLALHATGGTKRPKGGSLAVPTQNVRRTGTGKIGKANRPRALIAAGKGFKATLRKSSPAIFKRKGKGGRKLELMYSLLPTARIKARFPFEKDATATASRAFPNNFSKAMARAIASAK